MKKPEPPRHRPQSAPDARAMAVRIIADVVQRRLPLDDRLEQLAAEPDFAALSPSDRGLARAIASSAIRGLGVIRAELQARLRDGMPAGVPLVEAVLIAGAAQILFLDVADYAAVDTAVDRLKADRRGERYAALANAVLRGIARDQAAIRAGMDPLRDNTPAWLAERWIAAHGRAAAQAMAAAHLAEPPLDLSVRSDPESWAVRLNGSVLPTGSVRLPKAVQVPGLDGFSEGAWWVQDVAAAVPALLLGARAGERVLDLCAAPGGKTAQLALTGAAVTAVDRSPARVRRLEENMERLQMQVETVVADALAFEAAPFHRILLDAPCSATGTIRRHPDVAWSKTLADIAALADLQQRLLDRAWALLLPGGTLVYATCSLEPEEGERQVAAFMARTPDARGEPVTPTEIGGWAEPVQESGWFRALPGHFGDRGGCDGFFAARIVKSSVKQ